MSLNPTLSEMVKVVIFDYDDTLVKSSEALYDADCRAAASLGLQKPGREEYFSHWGEPHGEMIAALHPGVDIGAYLAAYGRIYKPEMLGLFEDVRGVLKTLTSKGIRLAVLSAKQRDFLEQHLQHAGIRYYFEHIHSAESSPYKKPDPRVFEDIIAHFSIPPSEMLYVGDSTKDLEAATSAGLGFVAVASGVQGPDDFRRLGCRRVLSRLSELPAYL